MTAAPSHPRGLEHFCARAARPTHPSPCTPLPGGDISPEHRCLLPPRHPSDPTAATQLQREGWKRVFFFFQGWVSGGAADPAVTSVPADFQISPSRCYAGGTAAAWLPNLGSGSPACRAPSLAFGSAASPPGCSREQREVLARFGVVFRAEHPPEQLPLGTAGSSGTLQGRTQSSSPGCGWQQCGEARGHLASFLHAWLGPVLLLVAPTWTCCCTWA